MIDAPLNLAAVGFELRFTGSAGADAAAELRHGFAPAREPRQHVFELCQLHLQLAFAGARMARKNVEDQLRAVQHAAWQSGLKVAQLRRREVVIEQHQVRFGRSGDSGNLFHFPGSDKRRRIGPWTPLEQFSRDFGACAGDKLAKLRQRFLDTESRGTRGNWLAICFRRTRDHTVLHSRSGALRRSQTSSR